MVICGSLRLKDYSTLFLPIFGLIELFTFFEKLLLWKKLFTLISVRALLT